MRALNLSLVAALIAGCAAATKKPLNTEFINGESSGSVKSDKIIKEMKRGQNQYGHYFLEVYPYTKMLIETEVKELASKNMDSPDKVKKAIGEKMNLLANKSTCFMFELWTGGIERSRFNQWRAKVEDSEGKLHDVEFMNVRGVSSVPSPMHNSPTGYTWLNVSAGCSKSVDMAKGFKVHVIPQFEGPTTILEWTSPK